MLLVLLVLLALLVVEMVVLMVLVVLVLDVLVVLVPLLLLLVLIMLDAAIGLAATFIVTLERPADTMPHTELALLLLVLLVLVARRHGAVSDSPVRSRLHLLPVGTRLPRVPEVPPYCGTWT